MTATMTRPTHAVRPWTTGQVFGAGFLFGPVAAGLVLGEHAARLGQKPNRLAWFLGGVAIAVGLLGVALSVPDDKVARLGWAVGIVVGAFAAWLARTMTDHAGLDPKEKHPGPAGVGRLFALGFAGLAINLAIVVPALLVAAR
jgi:hypothetical protein